ncbi:hypothetical protein ACTHOQ_12895 [Solibacillus silvestris]|uniref:hypothetical protein n=1 Tax=Solibacillus silvestris TaxID=76853 RepID=UPI003F81B924
MGWKKEGKPNHASKMLIILKWVTQCIVPNVKILFINFNQQLEDYVHKKAPKIRNVGGYKMYFLKNISIAQGPVPKATSNLSRYEKSLTFFLAAFFIIGEYCDKCTRQNCHP